METTLKNVLSDAFWIMPATPKYKNQGIPYITSKNIKNRRISFNDVKYIDKADYDVISKNRPILENDILISMIGTLGEVAVVQKEDGCFYGQNMYLIRLDESKISQKYFLNWVESDAVKRAILQQQNKSTQSYLKAEHIEGLLINVPNMIEQDRIAVSLEKINAVIEKRKQQLQKLDEFVKARFVEMFGDPVINNMNWRLQPLRESLKNIRYGTSSTPNFSDSGYSFIRATNIKSGHILLKDMKYISDKEAEKIKKCKLEVGEIIVVRSGVNSGDTCVIDKRFENQYAGYDIILTLCETLNSIFLNELFNTTYMDKVIKPLTRRAAQPHLNSEQIQGLPIIQVPMEMQNQFADFVQQIDKSKLSVQKSLDKLEILKKVLMQKYFG